MLRIALVACTGLEGPKPPRVAKVDKRANGNVGGYADEIAVLTAIRRLVSPGRI